MPNLNLINRQPPGGIAIPIDALAASMQHAVAVSGLSRSGIYRAAAEGKIRLLKCGRTTLVDMASVRDFLAALPVAQINTGKAA